MKKALFHLLLLILAFSNVLESVRAESRVIGVSLRHAVTTSNASIDLLSDIPEDTRIGISVAVAADDIIKLQSHGSAIFLFISAESMVQWSNVQKIIDAANKNQYIVIKSIKIGDFIKTHEQVMHDLEALAPRP